MVETFEHTNRDHFQTLEKNSLHYVHQDVCSSQFDGAARIIW